MEQKVIKLGEVLKPEPSVIALGNFDGVHLGHQEVIKNAIRFAKDAGFKSCVLTFTPNPSAFFRPIEFKALCDANSKYNLMKNLGVDSLYEIEFNKELASLEPEEFVVKVLIEMLNIKHLITGHNFKFGKGKSGDYRTLQELSAKYNFKYSIVRQVSVSGYSVSSTLIRSLISNSRVNLAAKLLGRFYSVSATVIKGKGLAKSKLGFATANLVPAKDIIKPQYGVYFVKVIFEDKEFFGVMNFGVRPSIEIGDSELYEVHIFDFEQDVYNKELIVELISFIRPEVKFQNLEALKYQIERDVRDARFLTRNIKQLTSL